MINETANSLFVHGLHQLHGLSLSQSRGRHCEQSEAICSKGEDNNRMEELMNNRIKVKIEVKIEIKVEPGLMRLTSARRH